MLMKFVQNWMSGKNQDKIKRSWKSWKGRGISQGVRGLEVMRSVNVLRIANELLTYSDNAITKRSENRCVKCVLRHDVFKHSFRSKY